MLLHHVHPAAKRWVHTQHNLRRMICIKCRKHPIILKIYQATTMWLFRAMVMIVILISLALLVAESMSVALPPDAWKILLLLLPFLAYVYLIAWLNGEWDDKRHLVYVEPVINILLLLVFLLLIAAYVQHVVFGEKSLEAYLEVAGTAFVVLMATCLVAVVERKK